MGGVYVPRSPTTGVLYGVVRGHWSDFAADVRDRTDGAGLPAFVVSEFRKFRIGTDGAVTRGGEPARELKLKTKPPRTKARIRKKRGTYQVRLRARARRTGSRGSARWSRGGAHGGAERHSRGS